MPGVDIAVHRVVDGMDLPVPRQCNHRSAAKSPARAPGRRVLRAFRCVRSFLTDSPPGPPGCVGALAVLSVGRRPGARKRRPSRLPVCPLVPHGLTSRPSRMRRRPRRAFCGPPPGRPEEASFAPSGVSARSSRTHLQALQDASAPSPCLLWAAARAPGRGVLRAFRCVRSFPRRRPPPPSTDACGAALPRSGPIDHPVVLVSGTASARAFETGVGAYGLPCRA